MVDNFGVNNEFVCTFGGWVPNDRELYDRQVYYGLYGHVKGMSRGRGYSCQGHVKGMSRGRMSRGRVKGTDVSRGRGY